MRELVAEQRRETQVGLAVFAAPGAVVGAGPGVPGVGSCRVGGRAQGQQIQQHRLVVAFVVVRRVTGLRRPAVADGGRAHLGPAPVDAAVEGVGEPPDLSLVSMRAVEPRAAIQRAGHQQRGVDGGELDILEARAGFHVDEVIEKALVARVAGSLRPLRRVVEKAQRGQHAGPGLFARDPVAFYTDRVGREREADGRDAGERRCRPAIGCQPGAGIGGVPEKAEAALLEVVEQRVDALGRARVGLGRVRLACLSQATE